MKSHDEKSRVQVRLISVMSQNEKSEIGNIKISWERGDNNGTTKVFSIGEEINEEFSFISTFQYSKGHLKPKILKLNIISRNMTIGSETINLSDYFNDKASIGEQSINKLLNVGKEILTIKLLLLFGDHLFSTPKVSKQKTRIMGSPNTSSSKVLTSSSCNTPKRKICQSTISVSKIPSSKTSLDLTRSFEFESTKQTQPVFNTLNKESNGDPIISHRTIRSIDRIHRATADASQIRSALDQPTIGSNSNSIARQSSFRQIKRDGPLRESSTRELKVNTSRRNTVEVLTGEEELLIKDIGRHSSFMELEEQCKSTDNTLLTQIIYSSMPIEKFISNSGLPEVICTQLQSFVIADILPLKLCVYLFSSISKLITLYETLGKKQRIESLVQFNEDIQKIGSKCYTRLFEIINLKFHKAWEISLNQNCSDKPILQELNSIVNLVCEFRTIGPFKTLILNDMFKVLNISFYEEVIKDHCTLMMGIQIQMLLGIVSDFEYKLKNLLVLKDNLIIIKEIGRVLVLNQKNLLVDDSRSEICPHLTDEKLVNLLTNYDKLNPKEIPSGTISLLSRNVNQRHVEFYDFSLPELKEQKLKDLIRDAVGCPWTPFDLSTTPLASRSYLQKTTIN
ncbi:hypothetical protein ENUP19_0121G0202 [Entamoeba nuttalli]|uniref:Dilute domain-containing protein n=2 Tax=Entamoeba nuttalli TaxID=412467 RepID=K2HYL0_ENTNP|nr:hypothetical protein ENU1_054090 [Entamoeba nuttalli P19]EKE41495.1 hypothetical protein ENU1_054090 [Entamoeba nuttalli P19]|eukprot:XP_008856167.1 hypothetical protein ENU1_054090 [Entamoeba nuttalli P19]